MPTVPTRTLPFPSGIIHEKKGRASSTVTVDSSSRSIRTHCWCAPYSATDASNGSDLRTIEQGPSAPIIISAA